MSASNYDCGVFDPPSVVDAAASDTKSSDQLTNSGKRRVADTIAAKVSAASCSTQVAKTVNADAKNNVYYPYGTTNIQYGNDAQRSGGVASNSSNDRRRHEDEEYASNLTLFPRLVYRQRRELNSQPLVDRNRMSVGVTWREYASDASFPLKMRIFEGLYWPYTQIGPLPVFKTRIYVENFNLRAFTDNDDRNIVYIALDGKHIDAELEFIIARADHPSTNQRSDEAAVVGAVGASKATPEPNYIVQSLVMTHYYV